MIKFQRAFERSSSNFGRAFDELYIDSAQAQPHSIVTAPKSVPKNLHYNACTHRCSNAWAQCEGRCVMPAVSVCLLGVIVHACMRRYPWLTSARRARTALRCRVCTECCSAVVTAIGRVLHSGHAICTTGGLITKAQVSSKLSSRASQWARTVQ